MFTVRMAGSFQMTPMGGTLCRHVLSVARADKVGQKPR
jgi:hypothetical protein